MTTPDRRKTVEVSIWKQARDAIATSQAARDDVYRLYLLCEDTLRQVDRTRKAVHETLGRCSPPNQMTGGA